MATYPLPPRSFLTAGVLFIAAFLLYLSTLAPSVVTLFDDSLEFQLVTYRLGIAHPTGYPLYTLLGKLFTFIPVGNIAYRVNLMSAFFGAATVALLYLLILQMYIPAIPLTLNQERGNIPSFLFTWPVHLGGIIGALWLAVGLVFWQQATVAEVYTLNTFFVAALLLVAVLPLKEERKIGGLAFLFGLSLTHHRTMILLLPALIVYFYLVYGRSLFTPKNLLLGIGWGAIPLLLYLYLPWRGHVGSLDGAYQNTWAGFWRQVSASGYGLFILDNPFGHERDLAFYWNLLAAQFYITVPGFLGLAYLFRIGRQKLLILTGLAFLTYLFFNLFYNVTDIEVFFIPIFLLWAAWSGLGAAFLLNTAATFRYRSWRSGLVAVFTVIFAFILLYLCLSHRRVIQQQYTWQIHDYGIDILQQPLPLQESAIVGILGEMTLIRYFQQTENRRPDIETIAADLEADRLQTVETLLAAGKSVYLTRELPGAAERWSLAAVGPLIQVQPVAEVPEAAVLLNQMVTPEILLRGYTISWAPHTGSGPAPVRLILFWQPVQPIPTSLKISARLLNSAGEVQAVVDAVPVHFAYPTDRWRPGELVSDVYDLVLPVDTQPGQYAPLIIWYNPAQGAAEVGRVELGPVTID